MENNPTPTNRRTFQVIISGSGEYHDADIPFIQKEIHNFYKHNKSKLEKYLEKEGIVIEVKSYLSDFRLADDIAQVEE